MHPAKGPRQPVAPHPNGVAGYRGNPIENLPVEECAPWEEPAQPNELANQAVFSAQALKNPADGKTTNPPEMR